MPRKDVYHDSVVRLLTADGWRITDDPLTLTYGGKDLFEGLGAEPPIAAEKAGKRIAVEIKSFVGTSDVRDLEVANGQFALYRDVLAELQPDRILYMAVPLRAYNSIFCQQLGQLIVTRQDLRLLVFNEVEERIEQWIPTP